MVLTPGTYTTTPIPDIEKELKRQTVALENIAEQLAISNLIAMLDAKVIGDYIAVSNAKSRLRKVAQDMLSEADAEPQAN